MGGTSYESTNVFKLISRTNHQIPTTHAGKNSALLKDQSMSPPLKPIVEELVQRKEKNIVGAFNTQSKFFMNQQQTRNNAAVLIQSQKSRAGGRTSDSSNNQSESQTLKSYNITQEKFFSGKHVQNQVLQIPHNSNSSLQTKMHQSFYNKQKVSDQNFDLTNNSMSGNINHHRGSRGSNAVANRQSQENMIKEERHDEISEEDDEDSEDEPRDAIRSSPYQRRIQNKKASQPYESSTSNSQQKLTGIDEEKMITLQMNNSSAYPMNIDCQRPSNRLGCSRAFHQTKENWKEASQAQVSSGTQSLPRNNQQASSNLQDDGNGSGQYSCKATSSAASLNILNKQQLANNQQLIYNHAPIGQATSVPSSTGGGNNSSISPKPFNKWAGNGNQINPAQKIQEMQKEVNLMYLGSVASANKKKAGAPVKLNPIARPSGADPGQSFVL